MSDSRHFCSCGDVSCPLNPNNPTNLAKGLGCDGCMRKNLSLGEVPSCIFKALGDIETWDDFSVEGFAHFVAEHPRGADERERCRRAAAAFEEGHAT
ncbi:DUF6485 family protein [Olsenella sp. HMSC062G07]|uniref:DUF6485 family protein n=1 Tax=Olsenella sp. HMSC062G07 TaxID=1739330 RepID=UPI0008A54AE2|nr:DUF6485 family protein [Olsenella sp. HMSC062G07]OFK22202.1 hypothetical protein HMPREF2826_02625 [Olsenella sp. HMSC062G07]